MVAVSKPARSAKGGQHDCGSCCTHEDDSSSDESGSRSGSSHSHVSGGCQSEPEPDNPLTDIYMSEFAMKVDDSSIDGWAKDFQWLLGVTDFLTLEDLIFAWRCTSKNLSVAILKHRAGALDLLLQRSALVFAKVLYSSSGKLAPHMAAKSGDAGTVNVLGALGSLGCAMDHRDVHGKTAAHHVVEWGDLASLRELNKLGCPMSGQDCAGKTALHIAAELGDVQVLKVLNELGCSMCIQDNQGRTAAHLAAGLSDIQAIRALCDLGCSLSTKDFNGNTVADIAREIDDDELLRAIEDCESK